MTIAVTYTFSNGTTSSATEVNTNFQDIIDGVTDGTEPISVGQLTVAGATALNGNTTIGNASSDDLTITASLASTIAIKTNNSYGIGGAALGVTGVYFSSHADYTTRLVFGSGAANITWTLPGTNGTAGHGLLNNGSGTWSYNPLQVDILTTTDADYTITDTDGYGVYLFSTGSSERTVTLPTAADNTDRKIVIKKIDSGTGALVIDGENAETVEGVASFKLYIQYESVTLVCNGTAWYIVSAEWASGTYTPTLTNFANTSARTARVHQYKRINRNQVTVWGGVNMSPSTTGATGVDGTLPITQTATGEFDIIGGGGSLNDRIYSVLITSDSAGKFRCRGTCRDAASIDVGYTFSYLIA
jgi:hypothetical protein